MESSQLNSQRMHVSSNLFIQYPDEKIYVSKQSKLKLHVTIRIDEF